MTLSHPPQQGSSPNVNCVFIDTSVLDQLPVAKQSSDSFACFIMSEKLDTHGQEKAADSTVEDVILKGDDAAVAVAEEHSLSVWGALSSNKRVVFWCVFFAFSCIGWYVTRSLMTSIRGSFTDVVGRGFDAQVNGAMIGVPQFRLTFG